MNNGISNRKQWENSEISVDNPITFMRVNNKKCLERNITIFKISFSSTLSLEIYQTCV